MSKSSKYKGGRNTRNKSPSKTGDRNMYNQMGSPTGPSQHSSYGKENFPNLSLFTKKNENSTTSSRGKKGFSIVKQPVSSKRQLEKSHDSILSLGAKK